MGWTSQKGSYSQGVPPRAQVRVMVVSPTPILVKDTQRPLHWFSEGNHRQLLELHGSDQLIFEPKDSKAEYAVSVSVVPRQTDEPHNHEAPPQPAPPQNFLQQVRQAIQAELGGMRENFLRNHTAYPGYELDDEEPDLFEEELLDQMKEAEEKSAPSEPEETPEPETAPEPETGKKE